MKIIPYEDNEKMKKEFNSIKKELEDQFINIALTPS
jgi:hypothetical protein